MFIEREDKNTMILKRLQVKTGQPNLRTNTYVICDENTKEAMVIDPGGEADRIIELLNILQVNQIKYIFLTHCHADHIGAIHGLKTAKGGKILVSRADSEGLYNKEISLADYVNMQIPELEADSRIDDGDLIHVGELEFKVIATPGHTSGSVCLYCEKERLIFTGDTLFSGTWGRTDLPTGSFLDIMSSISERLMTLPEETICYPGHGKTTMIEDEKNIYVELKEKEF